jgi:hypothetical protein
MAPVADFLETLGKDVAKGASSVGKVLAPIAERTAQVVSGQAPEIDAEQRAQQTKMEDAQIEVRANQLEDQLAIGQKYGTLTPEQQQQYVDQITGLYSHPRHAGTLMEKLRKAVHPNGAVASPGALSTLKNAVPPGGTLAADNQAKAGLVGQEDEEKKAQALKSIDWFKKNMLPMFPPDQQATKLNEYIDHINGITQGTEKPPKGLKAMEQGGVFFGVEDQDTGKQYLKSQLGPGGDAPPEAKQMAAAVDKAAKDKQDVADAKEKDINDRQMKTFSHQLEMQNVQIQKAMEIGDFREARREISKADEGYQAAVDRMGTMDSASVKAKGGDQQAMFAILANHIAMTLQQPQVSTRPTKAMFDEAASSLPWMANITKKFSPDGYLLGVTLSPEQIDQMTGLAHDKVETQKDHVERLKTEYKDDLNPQPVTTKPGGVARAIGKVDKPGGATTAPKVIVVSPEDMK